MDDKCDSRGIGGFIADYTSWLFGCGATCTRIEKNVKRIAHAYGLDAEISIMHRHVTVTLVKEADDTPLVYTRRIVGCGINFDINTRLSTLSWNIADHHLGIGEAKDRFRSIVNRPYTRSVHIILLTALANASFCRLFGGDAVAMAVVCAATLVGMVLKTILIKSGADIRIVFMLCAFVSAVICYGAELFGWGTTPETAIATSVLYLIPGVPYINSASDLIGGYYISFISRFVDACVLTACLSLGLIGALSVMGAGNLL